MKSKSVRSIKNTKEYNENLKLVSMYRNRVDELIQRQEELTSVKAVKYDKQPTQQQDARAYEKMLLDKLHKLDQYKYDFIFEYYLAVMMCECQDVARALYVDLEPFESIRERLGITTQELDERLTREIYAMYMPFRVGHFREDVIRCAIKSVDSAIYFSKRVMTGELDYYFLSCGYSVDDLEEHKKNEPNNIKEKEEHKKALEQLLC